MPYHMKIQPIDSDVSETKPLPETTKQVPKSRLKRLFERQFTTKNVSDESPLSRENSGEFEPSSVCLAKMVLNFMEDNNGGEKQQQLCGRRRCNCFNGSGTESSDDESDLSDGLKCSPSEILKSLVLCTSVTERNVLEDVSKIAKEESGLGQVAKRLVSLGYDAAVCKSRWERSPSCAAGEYEYVDVVIRGERLLIDIDFKSKFEVARATKTYKSILQTLPNVFVGKADRLERIVVIVSMAAKQSLTKKGLDVPPWRRVEYVKSKWLSPYARGEQGKVKQSVDMLSKSVGSLVF